MKSVLKPFPSRRLSKTKFFYWEPTATNKPTVYLATESKGVGEAGRLLEGGRKEREEGGEEGRAGFFSSSFILQKGCNQHSGERWHRVSHKTAQWPRRRGQATYQAGTRVGQGPHCPAGHCWRLQRPLTSPASTPSFPTLAFFSPGGPTPSSLGLAFLRMASSCLSAW